MSLTKVSYSMISGAPLNVLDYGAVPDGVTDSTAQIQAALDAAAAQGTALASFTNLTVDGGGLAYRISAPLEITARCNFVNIVLIVETTYADVVLYLKGASSCLFDNIEIKTDKENDPTLTGLAGRAQKEGQYIGIRLDKNQRAVFDNVFNRVKIQRPKIAILYRSDDPGGFNTSNNFNDCTFLGFEIGLEAFPGSSLTEKNQFNNCYFYNQRSTDTILYKTSNAVNYQIFDGCFFWQDGATKATLIDTSVRWLEPLMFINGGYWEIDSFELLNDAVSFTTIGLTDKDEGEFGSSYAVIMPAVTSQLLENLIPTTNMTRWNVSTGWTEDTKTFRGNKVYKTTTGITARVDLTFNKQDYTTNWPISFSGWMKTNGTNSNIYVEIRYSDSSTDFQSAPFAKGDNKFRLIGTKFTFSIDNTKTVNRIIAYVVPGNATECYFTSAAICQSTKIPFISQEKPFNWLEGTDLSNLDFIRESDDASILTGKTVSNAYFFQWGELCYVTARIDWTGVTGTSASLTRIKGMPFFGLVNARGLGTIAINGSTINTFEIQNDGEGYVFADGDTVATNAFPTSGRALISIVYKVI